MTGNDFDINCNCILLIFSIFPPSLSVSGSKCSRDSLKLCIEMLIMRWSLIARHSIVAFLEIANAIIPKWHIKARHIIETTISRRRRNQQDQRIKAVPVTKHDNDSMKRDVIREVDENEGEQVQANDSLSRLKASEGTDVTTAAAQTQTLTNERVMRQALTVAVTGCIVLLAVQVCLAVALLLQSLRTIPLGLVFLVSCLAYIAYLLQSVRETHEVQGIRRRRLRLILFCRSATTTE